MSRTAAGLALLGFWSRFIHDFEKNTEMGVFRWSAHWPAAFRCRQGWTWKPPPDWMWLEL